MDYASEKKYGYGLALSGGVTRCFAHLGVLQALEEREIRPDIISAVSAGAIVAALYADGRSPRDILKAITSRKLLYYLQFSLVKKGLMQMTGFEKSMKELLSVTRIEELKIPMIIYTVNLNKAEYTGFSTGELIPVIKASCSLPIIFPPVKIEEDYHVDGGVINNFPIDPLIGHCQTLIGVNVNPIGKVARIGGALWMAERIFKLLVRSHTLGRKLECDYFIEPPGLITHGLLEMSKAQEIFDLGYDEAMRVLENPPLKVVSHDHQPQSFNK